MATQAEREEWFRSPVTQEFLQQLKLQREETKERWARQHFMDIADSHRANRLNMYALAGVDILVQVIDLVEQCRPQTLEEKEG